MTSRLCVAGSQSSQGGNLWFNRVPAGAPFIQPALHAGDLREAGIEQDISSLLGAVAGAAHDYNFLVVRDFVQAGGKLVERDKRGIRRMKIIPLLLCANVQDKRAVLVFVVRFTDADLGWQRARWIALCAAVTPKHKQNNDQCDDGKHDHL